MSGYRPHMEESNKYKHMMDTLFHLLYAYRCFLLAIEACTFMKQTGLGADWRIRRQHLQPPRVATSAFLPKKQVVQQEAFYGILWSSAQCERGNASWQALDFVSPVHSMFGYVDGFSIIYIYIKNTLPHHNNITMRGTDLVCLYSCGRVHLYVLMGHVLSV